MFGCVNEPVSGEWINKDVLNMSNTVSPIISKIAEVLCQYENIQINIGESSAKGGQLIYKRESVEGCISGIGNIYYIRCYDWQYDEQDRLWYRPTEDIPTDTYSCISESQVNIPYANRKLQNAEIGVKYYVHGN